MKNAVGNGDVLRIIDLVFQANHGCTSAEREVGATFRVSLELYFDQRVPAKTDALKDTADVQKVYELVEQVIHGPARNLTETVAAEIADRLLDELGFINGIKVKIHKSRSPMPGPTGGFEIEITRKK